MDSRLKGKRLGIGARRSKDDTDREESVRLQVKEGTAFGEANEMKIHPVFFVDNDAPAGRTSTKPRPGLKEFRQTIEAGQLDAMWWRESERLGRHATKMLDLYDVCADMGVLVILGSTVYDPDDPDDMFTLTILAGAAQRPSGVARKNVKGRQAEKRERGESHGVRPYGYQRIYSVSSRGRKMIDGQEPHEDEAPVVKRIFEQYADGETVGNIIKGLDRDGIAPPIVHMSEKRASEGSGKWSHQGIKNLVTNPAYIGKLRYKGEVISDGKWPPLVSEETFALCAARVERMAKPGHDTRVKHLLAGVVRCSYPDCKKSFHMSGARKRVNQSGLRRYVCKGNHCSRIYETLEKVVVDATLDWWQSWASGSLRPPTDSREVNAVRDEIERLENRLATFIADNATGTMNEKAYQATIAAIQTKIDAERAKCPEPVVLPEIVHRLGPGMSAVEVWEGVRDDDGELIPDTGMSFEDKRALLLAVAKVTVFPAGQGKRDSYGPEHVRIEFPA